jgi:hypothetical protein
MIRRLLAVLALATAVPGILIGMVIPASAAVHTAAVPARTTPLPVLYNLGGGSGASEWNLPQRRPTIFYLAADGSAALGETAHPLKWTLWTMTSAAATGRYYYRTGPCCTYQSDPVTITANHVVAQNANTSWYDRMTIRFSKTKSVTIQYERINGIGFWKTVAGRFP